MDFLKRFVSLFPGANAQGLFQVVYKNLAVTDTPGYGRFSDGVNHRLNPAIRNCNFKFQLGQKIHHVFGASIQFSVTLLSAETPYFSDCHTLDSRLGQCISDVIQFKGLDDRGYHFHIEDSGTGVSMTLMRPLQGRKPFRHEMGKL